jgi:hypothetical protein
VADPAGVTDRETRSAHVDTPVPGKFSLHQASIECPPAVSLDLGLLHVLTPSRQKRDIDVITLIMIIEASVFDFTQGLHSTANARAASIAIWTVLNLGLMQCGFTDARRAPSLRA